ncbi:MAG: helix-turn-helix domain-containing protein [Halocynthiibacter sp.]
MSRTSLTGSRIRERRMVLGLRQAELARIAGISAAYLNLIEHNRRRIGGKLLLDIARILDVEPAHLSEGAEMALVSSLEIAAAGREADVETQHINEFVGRFPGWARFLSELHGRGETLTQTVEVLTDRLAHDPQLSSSLHEMLSSVTSIRSTSSILARSDDIDPNWQARFQKNLFEDAVRLAESSQALVAYLDSATDMGEITLTPQEEIGAYLEAVGHHIPALENGDMETARADVAHLGQDARGLLDQFFTTYLEDVKRLPLSQFQEAAATLSYQPDLLAEMFSVSLPAVFRRLASLPFEDPTQRIGLVVADGAGAISYRKPIDGFAIPRIGAACALWPLFHALSVPSQLMQHWVSQMSRDALDIACFSYAHPKGKPALNAPRILESHMLLVPQLLLPERAGPRFDMGSTCRICPKRQCDARREPSVLAEEF